MAFSQFYVKIMKVTYIHVTILAYFLTDTLNWHVLRGKEKHLLNNKLKNKVSLKRIN